MLQKAVEGPQYSMRPKTANPASHSIPGPGAYDHDAFGSVLETSPRPRIGSAKRTDPMSQSMKALPGPGTYESTGTLSGPRWGFGSERRSQEVKSVTPGAGTYEIKPTLSVQGYSIRPKYADNSLKESASVPGPGAYNPSLMSARGFIKVGTGSRSDFTKGSGAPGPGTYNLALRPSSAGPK